MIYPQTCFNSFSQNIKDYTLPERFTFPFCYDPHPLCLLAATELQNQLENHQQLSKELEQQGKMFGVLLVKNQQGEIGYLIAFSGKHFDLSIHQASLKNNMTFVPAVFELNEQAEWYYDDSIIINRLNHELEQLLVNPNLEEYQSQLTSLAIQQEEQLAQQHEKMAFNRKTRKAKRSQVRDDFTEEQLAEQLKELAKQSVYDKNELKALKQYWLDLITAVQEKLTALTDEVDAVKNKRKKLSTRLQKKLFKQYHLLNSAGVEKDLIELFQDTRHPMPPAGTGDCAAPKLLQYAFMNNMTPLAMAEFWWGRAPKSEIRQHKKFYGACSGKCQPILAHMLEGMVLDDNPLLINPAEGKALDIIYQDTDIVVVNKPNEFLSVPGKNIEDSVYLRIKALFPQATGTLIVHRLDMSTSGLMVLALTKRAQKNIQQQFINRTIKKRYVALLENKVAANIDKIVEQSEGDINLPLRGDLDDRPRQLVCFNAGKASKTHWQVIEHTDEKIKLYLYPESGRTHQLRVHCAHPQGLNTPILGDDLYGNNNDNIAQRLHLHAQRLTLRHPVSQEEMTFQVNEAF
ncbi:RluA family pseudouridine synthase [Colwellia sp. 20A7]|uniref:RluA family pseudouridine synthase n=1 Tax=Colwellia sp. 20A7 TaxID=2689569 RepID=UPI001359C4B5|nr:RluA family pseudouridine synthase [Colwellia sp. 20A7]